MKSFAISFKGGASRGMGAIGIIRFLQEENITPKIVAGSSSGAIIAAAYSLGYQWNDILKFASNIRLWRLLLLRSTFKESSLISGKKYRAKLLSLHDDVNIENLPIKLIILQLILKIIKRFL